MIVSVAACPQPPLLLPELATGAAADLAPVRAACASAVRELVRQPVEQVLVVGAGARADSWGPNDHGSFARYGRELPVDFGGDRSGRTFGDLSLLVAARLLADVPVPRLAVTVPATASTDECLATGRRIAADSGNRPIGLLVMGDAAARRALAEPGAVDAEADEFDAAVREAFAAGDPAALRALDPDRARALSAVGRAPWQVLAGALAEQRWAARLHYAGAPAEVTYLVATWRPR
ncbi:hypothetical protein Athai_41200 [Actinocatenispora thailandica]|uniref:Uncharacterized protein n=1 Tax=Actinocatenispora thailandica TaxID=227318 RepID=A0A7R7DSA2_9ACTN|nr:hypothetical protein [Actinocatenispora thailandica]BCJ36617.1 hypothetical protein Athai_41200 [Actinocatenispora thailandica]